MERFETILFVLWDIIRSIILPRSWVGEVTCCERLKLVRRSVRGLSTCGKTGMLKSPSMVTISMP